MNKEDQRRRAVVPVHGNKPVKPGTSMSILEGAGLNDPEVLAGLLRMEKKLAEKKRRRQAMDKACKIARFLKEEYGAEKVYLYGSLAWGNFQAHSDLDLFASGLKTDRYWKMQLQVEELAAPFAVSIVCDTRLTPH